MTIKRTIWLVRASVSIGLLLLLVGLVQPAVSGAGTIILEDFSSLRSNGDGDPLWAPYPNPDGGSDYANQTGSVENGTYHLHTGGRPYFHFHPSPYLSPNGFAKGNLRGGSWDSSSNRMTFWIKAPRNISRRSDGGTIAEVGTYTKQNDGQPSNQGSHFYHYLDPNFIGGRWMLVTLNRVPQHEVGASDPNPSYPENPTSWPYFDGLTRFYFCDEYGSASSWNGDWYFADFEFGKVSGEPDQLVATVAAVYTGSHYEVSWQGPRNTSQSYTVYVSPSSMKASGVGSGTQIGTAQTTGNTYAGVFVSGPSMSQYSGGTYIAIQPNGQSAFTEIYLPLGPGQGSGSGSPPPTPTAPAAPTNVHVVQ